MSLTDSVIAAAEREQANTIQAIALRAAIREHEWIEQQLRAEVAQLSFWLRHEREKSRVRDLVLRCRATAFVPHADDRLVARTRGRHYRIGQRDGVNAPYGRGRAALPASIQDAVVAGPRRPLP